MISEEEIQRLEAQFANGTMNLRQVILDAHLSGRLEELHARTESLRKLNGSPLVSGLVETVERCEKLQPQYEVMEPREFVSGPAMRTSISKEELASKYPMAEPQPECAGLDRYLETRGGCFNEYD